jgi:GTPase
VTSPAGFRAGYVAIIGEPNVGKSTLMNTLLGQKISIVTHKPQTTRDRILGILSTEAHQIVFLDTPGLITPKYLLHQVMMQSADAAIADADVLLFMIDATDPKTGVEPAHEDALGRLRSADRPVFLVINKVDAVQKAELLPVMDFYSRAFAFREIFPISALHAENTAELLASLAPLMPEHPPYFPTDIVSEHPERFFVAEIVREKIFVVCREEVPYATAVDVVEFREKEGEKTFIAAEISVERESQKGILIGKQGAMLKTIGARARRDIETFLGRPVFLDLHVRVRPRWREDAAWLSRLGYPPKS